MVKILRYCLSYGYAEAGKSGSKSRKSGSDPHFSKAGMTVVLSLRKFHLGQITLLSIHCKRDLSPIRNSLFGFTYGRVTFFGGKFFDFGNLLLFPTLPSQKHHFCFLLTQFQ